LLALDRPLLNFFVEVRPAPEFEAFFELLREEPEALLVDRPLFPLFLLELDLLDAVRAPPNDVDDFAFDEAERPLALEFDEDVRPLFELLDPDPRPPAPLDDVIVSAAAPTAPTAAPAAAPDSISPATSMTLSINFDDVDLRALVDPRVDEDVLFLSDLLELDLLAIVSPFVRN